MSTMSTVRKKILRRGRGPCRHASGLGSRGRGRGGGLLGGKLLFKGPTTTVRGATSPLCGGSQCAGFLFFAPGTSNQLHPTGPSINSTLDVQSLDLQLYCNTITQQFVSSQQSKLYVQNIT